MIPARYREDEKIIAHTIEQIKKDFDRHLPKLVFSGNPAIVFEELKVQVSTALKIIYSQDRLSFKPLLYKIDIREPDMTYISFEELAEKVIHREFKKVLTRKFYSKNSPGKK